MYLKEKIKTEEQYMVNLLDVSPVKKEVVKRQYDECVIVNRVACGDARDQKENLDRDFG